MTTTNAESTGKTRTGEKALTEPPWNVVLHNYRNPINRMVWRLWKTILGMTMKGATGVTWRAHRNGRAVAKTCQRTRGTPRGATA